MAEIRWTDEAQHWLGDIYEYIAADNAQAAAQTVQGIYERAQVLTTFPEIGHRYQASPRNVRILLYGHGGFHGSADRARGRTRRSVARWSQCPESARKEEIQ